VEPLISITQFKQINRYRQIAMVFVKHGFGAILDQIGLLKYLKLPRKVAKAVPPRRSIGERLRLSLEELGPTFVKLGQIISLRPIFLPRDVVVELEKLQDAVPAIPFADIQAVIAGEFPEPLELLYAAFDEQPLAAASIAQVHPARLHTGETVVVKVQRPGIERIIDLDLRILEDIAGFIDTKTKYGKLYNFTQMVQEFETILKQELDFRIEAKHADILRANLRRDPVSIPSIHWEQTSRRVLTMEYINGIPLSDLRALDSAGLDRKALARNLSATILYQILRDGFFHADPHPGNVMALPGNKIALLDLGMVGRLSEERQTQFLKILIGLSFGNDQLIVQAMLDLDIVHDQPVNVKRLGREVGRIRDKYLTLAVNEIKVGEALHELFHLAFSFHLMIPEEFAILAKTLLTLEALVQNLDPEISVLEIAQPIAKRLLYKTLSPGKLRKEMMKGLIDYGLLVQRLPSFL
jgi:ubiquinone biosynthesis protein